MYDVFFCLEDPKGQVYDVFLNEPSNLPRALSPGTRHPCLGLNPCLCTRRSSVRRTTTPTWETLFPHGSPWILLRRVRGNWGQDNAAPMDHGPLIRSGAEPLTARIGRPSATLLQCSSPASPIGHVSHSRQFSLMCQTAINVSQMIVFTVFQISLS